MKVSTEKLIADLNDIGIPYETVQSALAEVRKSAGAIYRPEKGHHALEKIRFVLNEGRVDCEVFYLSRKNPDRYVDIG